MLAKQRRSVLASMIAKVSGRKDCHVVRFAWFKSNNLSAFLIQHFIVLKLYFVEIDVIFFARLYCMISQ